MNEVKIIGFDADDTLWVNEPHFQNTEKRFCELMAEYGTSEYISAEMFKTEMQNLAAYGFGAKAYILSLMETALRISENRVSHAVMAEIIALGKKLLDFPPEVIEGVEPVLKELSRKYSLVLITKGDLLDQERKVKRSGLGVHFSDIHILSDKNETAYKRIVEELNIRPHEFAMVGNSLKSDVLPALEAGCYGVYVPFYVTWQAERVEQQDITHQRYRKIEKITELPDLLK